MLPQSFGCLGRGAAETSQEGPFTVRLANWQRSYAPPTHAHHNHHHRLPPFILQILLEFLL